jgi:cytochrome b
MKLVNLLNRVLDRWSESEAGMTTAELLGNAALGVLALVVIWGLLQSLGVDIVNWMRSQLL